MARRRYRVFVCLVLFSSIIAQPCSAVARTDFIASGRSSTFVDVCSPSSVTSSAVLSPHVPGPSQGRPPRVALGFFLRLRRTGESILDSASVIAIVVVAGTLPVGRTTCVWTGVALLTTEAASRTEPGLLALHCDSAESAAYTVRPWRGRVMIVSMEASPGLPPPAPREITSPPPAPTAQVPGGPTGYHGPAGRREDAQGPGAHGPEAGVGGETAGCLERVEAEGVAEEVCF